VTVLLDANVLIALTIEEHEHHERATTWASTLSTFSICPIVEGALVRFLVRSGEAPVAAATLIQRIRDLPSCEFWPDSISYADVELGHVTGHRQVTDAYLVGLARDHGGALATLDERLASTLPDYTLLVPQITSDTPRITTDSLRRIASLGGGDPQASAPPRRQP
jgi:toxin-antitoxin system PIN domain toxin